jgi:tetratricopeptide (TPR) repeat protein
MTASLAMQQVETALAAAGWEHAAIIERVEMLVEIATGLQTRPRNHEDLLGALRLYDRALELCPPESEPLEARVAAKRGTLLQSIPGGTLEHIEQARQAFERALAVLETHANPEELAELEMNLGLAKHTLAAHGKCRLNECVTHYQRALRTFTREAYPAECAMLHNNLATAYLALPASDPSGRLREALAVQSFEAALQIITLEEFPNEYAMLQNNLGNALQNSTSGHALANRLRAIQAYEEALKVRTAGNQPAAYANTIANLALCLSNLPDDVERPDLGNPHNLARAHALYGEASAIFQQHDELDKAAAVLASQRELGAEAAS